MVLQQRRVLVEVRLGDVAGVVAVLLEEADHLVLGVPEVGVAAVGREGSVPRAVVGNRVGGLVGLRIAGRAQRRALVEAVAAIVVVGLPGRVRGLQDHVRVARVIAHDEGNQAVAASVVAHEMGDVDARNRRARDRPRGRDAPVAAVHDARRLRREAGRLAARRHRHAGGDLARAVAAVVAQAQDVEVVGGGGVDLEADRLPDVDAHLRREALNGGVAGAGDLPVGRRRAGLRVLARDRVGDGRRARVRGGMAARGQQRQRGRGSNEHEDQTPCDGHGLRQASGHARTPDFDVITRTERPGAPVARG